MPAELTRGLIAQLENTELFEAKFEHQVESLGWMKRARFGY